MCLSQDEIARLSALQPQVEKLHEQLQDLRQKEETQVLFDADISAFQEHYHQVLEDLRARERQLVLGEQRLSVFGARLWEFKSGPVTHYTVVAMFERGMCL